MTKTIEAPAGNFEECLDKCLGEETVKGGAVGSVPEREMMQFDSAQVNDGSTPSSPAKPQPPMELVEKVALALLEHESQRKWDIITARSYIYWGDKLNEAGACLSVILSELEPVREALEDNASLARETGFFDEVQYDRAIATLDKMGVK